MRHLGGRPDGQRIVSGVILHKEAPVFQGHCSEARHTEPHDLTLHFDRKRQQFTPTDTATSKPKPDGKLQSSLVDLWDRTKPAADDAGGNA